MVIIIIIVLFIIVPCLSLSPVGRWLSIYTAGRAAGIYRKALLFDPLLDRKGIAALDGAFFAS